MQWLGVKMGTGGGALGGITGTVTATGRFGERCRTGGGRVPVLLVMRGGGGREYVLLG